MRCGAPFCKNSAGDAYTESAGISFHAFPNEVGLRAAWLRALGKRDSRLPDSAVVCSQHFLDDDICETESGLRQLATGAVPSMVQVCMICLHTDSNLFLMSKHKMEEAYEKLTGYPPCDVGNLKQALCIQCAQRLRTFSQFRDKSLRARAILMDLVEKHKLITRRHIKMINRTKNQLDNNFVLTTLGPDPCDLYIQEHLSEEQQTDTEATLQTVEVKKEDSYDSMSVDEDMAAENDDSDAEYVNDEFVASNEEYLNETKDPLKCESVLLQCALCYEQFESEPAYERHMDMHGQAGAGDGERAAAPACEARTAASSSCPDTLLRARHGRPAQKVRRDPQPTDPEQPADLSGKKYIEDGDEINGELPIDNHFSPECSEYIPSLKRDIMDSPSSSDSSLGGDSHYMDRILANSKLISTPTISNLPVVLHNGVVGSPTDIHKGNDFFYAIQGVCEENTQKDSWLDINNSTQSLSDKSINESLDETLKLEQIIENENSNDKTLINDTQNKCSNDNIALNTSCAAECHVVQSGISTNQQHNYNNQQEQKRITRKRNRDESAWRCNKNKILKNSGKAYEGCNSKKTYSKKIIGPVCSCKNRCGEKVSSPERKVIFEHFYRLSDRELQWQYIFTLIKIENVKRMSKDRRNNRTQTIKYFFRLHEEVPVCKTFFLNTLGIGEQVVYTAVEKMKSDGCFIDKRGNHNNRPRKMDTFTEASVIAHIELFPKVESYYTRKNSGREYLSENLNISKMYRLYSAWFKQQDNNGVTMATKRQYETVFNTKYNYSFFKPKKDQCPSCSVYDQADHTLKAALENKHGSHLHTTERIRQIKKDEINRADKNDTTIAIFDLQKGLNIPQSEVGTFHYKRKYPVYNFTIFDALRKICHSYVWHFQIAKRGSTEIGSCLLNFFKRENEKGIINFSLYSDGCYGQSKNRFVFALYVYAAKLLGISITHRFFETGHSQNERDSMHACIEKNMKNKVIYTPDQIYDIILNSKKSGEKYRLKKVQQSDIYDIKKLVNPIDWRRDKEGSIIRWSDVVEVRVVHAQENKLLFRYNFEDSYSELDTSSLHTRRRGREYTHNVPMENDNFELKQAYHQPIPISKALYTDLMSLCYSGAIPRFYHPFYESLTYSDIENTNDTDEDF